MIHDNLSTSLLWVDLCDYLHEEIDYMNRNRSSLTMVDAKLARLVRVSRKIIRQVARLNKGACLADSLVATTLTDWPKILRKSFCRERPVSCQQALLLYSIVQYHVRERVNAIPPPK